VTNLNGKRIKEIRLSKKLGLNETAKKAGISGSYLSNIEKGIKTNPSTETLQKIAEVLNVSVEDFFKEETAKPTDIELNKKDKKEIEDILKQTEQQLLSAEGLMFDGKPASPETVEKIINAMRIGMELAKKEAKGKYTPKKYRK
jgi:transcriptional regulator with XRE-family HTH domain